MAPWYRSYNYEYIVTYIDDLLIASKDPQSLIKELELTYTLEGVGDPVYYSGADVISTSGDDDWKMEPIDWILSSKTYSENMLEKLNS